MISLSIYATYSILCSLFLNPLFQNSNYLVIFYSIGTFIIAAIYYILFSRKINKSTLNITVSIVLIPLIPGLILLQFIPFDKSSFFLYLISFFISALPILIGFIIHSFSLKNNATEMLHSNNEDYLINNSKPAKIFTVFNNKGKELISLPYQDIIVFEANDNYINTYYFSNGEVMKKMERFSLKKTEECVKIDHELDFIRVHKSYIINKSMIESIRGKSQAYRIKLENFDLEIPVSRSFKIDLLNNPL